MQSGLSATVGAVVKLAAAGEGLFSIAPSLPSLLPLLPQEQEPQTGYAVRQTLHECVIWMCDCHEGRTACETWAECGEGDSTMGGGGLGVVRAESRADAGAVGEKAAIDCKANNVSRRVPIKG